MSEWLEKNKTRSYPHVQSVALFDEVFLDAVITIPASVTDDSATNTQQAIVLDYLDLVNEEVAIEDTAPGGTVLFDSRVDPHTFVEYDGTSFYVAHWFTDDGFSVKLTFDKWGVTSAILPGNYSTAVPLTSSTVIRQPGKVTLFQADGNVMDANAPIILDEGYNCELKVSPNILEGSERRDIIQFSFRPGAGAGRYKDCDDPDIVIRRINGIEPDRVRNFNIQGDDCLFLRPHLDGDDDPDGLTLITYCTPCCSCDDMILTHVAVKKMLDEQNALILPHLYNARNALHNGINNYSGIANNYGGSGSSGFVRVYCRGAYIFQVQVILINQTDSSISSDLTLVASIDDDTVEGFAVKNSGFVFGSGATEIWTAQDPGGDWATGYTTAVVIPAWSWRGYQLEMSANRDDNRPSTTEFGCTVTATNITGSPFDEKTCDVVKVTCGEDCE